MPNDTPHPDARASVVPRKRQWAWTSGVSMESNDLAHLEKLGYEGVLAEMAKSEGRLGRPGSQVREEIEHWLKEE